MLTLSFATLALRRTAVSRTQPHLANHYNCRSTANDIPAPGGAQFSGALAKLMRSQGRSLVRYQAILRRRRR